MPDESVDLVFADPPFNVGKDYGGGPAQDMKDDYFFWCEKWITEGFRILKDTGSFYLMNICKNIGKLMCIMDKEGVFLNILAWKNVCAWATKRKFYDKFQPILFYGKSENYYFDTYAEREPPFSRWGKMKGKMQGQMGNIWMDIPFVWAGSTKHPEAIIKPGTNSKIHPCQMPLDIAKRCIVFSTKGKSVVLDPFSGIGTTAVAAKDLKRNYIGIEINPEYCEIAERRLKNLHPSFDF